MLKSGGTSAASSYFAFLWASNDNFDVIKGFFVTLGSAGGGILSSIFVMSGSRVHKKKTTKQFHLKNQIEKIKKNAFYKNPSFSNLTYPDCFLPVASRNPIHVSDYI